MVVRVVEVVGVADDVVVVVGGAGLQASFDWHLPPPLDCVASEQPDLFFT